MTNLAFAAYAARIAQKSAAWSADTIQALPEDVLDPMPREATQRYLREIRGILDHIEKQVCPE